MEWRTTEEGKGSKRRLVSAGTTEQEEACVTQLLLDRCVIQEATRTEGVRMLKRPSSFRNFII